jgi:large subunit ribosomal protein L24
MKVNTKKGRIVVENINKIKKHVRPSAQNRQGGIIEAEGQIDWANVMIMCNKCITPVRIKFQHLEDGKKVRVCRKCNELIDA